MTRSPRAAQEPLIDEPVVHDDVGAAQQREPAHGDEARIAGPRADERNRA